MNQVEQQKFSYLHDTRQTFSNLRLWRTYLRSTISQKRQTYLLLLNLNQCVYKKYYQTHFVGASIHYEILKKIVFRTTERKCAFGKLYI